jgi:hypothetical protein
VTYWVHAALCRWYVPGEVCTCEVLLLILDSLALPEGEKP